MSSSKVNTSISTSIIGKSKKNPGCPEGPVWNYFTKDEKLGKKVIKQLNQDELIELVSHLANYCPIAESTIIRYFLIKILFVDSKKDKPRKKET
ncbi:25699_t:CDS:2 [Gigaspora margarita]|uniref:25699_t:CDS:1 n=1 Tax=Gigaspora margarita TaxID=4874 RepID=A0ABM8VVW9_GIGMA|nr:25699_t:CDS:2 [Gigaspora margarita]